MKTVSAVEARKGLGHLLNLVSLKRETIVIERAGEKMAILKAYDSGANKKVAASREGRLNLLDLAGLGGEIWAGVAVGSLSCLPRLLWLCASKQEHPIGSDEFLKVYRLAYLFQYNRETRRPPFYPYRGMRKNPVRADI